MNEMPFWINSKSRSSRPLPVLFFPEQATLIALILPHARCLPKRAELRWHLDFRAAQQFVDGYELDLGIITTPARRMVKARRHRFGCHVAHGRLQHDKHGHSSVFARHSAAPSIAAFDVTALA